MISFNMFREGGIPSGFKLSGHADTASSGKDILCAAVSSAAYMTANTITDVLCLECDIDIADGHMVIKVKKPETARDILLGLRLHIMALQEEYPGRIEIRQ